MSEDWVSGDEVLYRRVPSHIKGLLKQLPDGRLGVSSSAFHEENHRPSVDRASIHEYEPQRTLGTMIGGVVSIEAHAVRSIDDLAQYGKNKQIVRKFDVDVNPDPIVDHPVEPDNPAHAEIYTRPECTRKVFDRLREKLALLANNRPWEVPPPRPQIEE